MYRLSFRRWRSFCMEAKTAERAMEGGMSLSKRVGVAITSPLDDAGILLHILNTLGPGQHLFISAVSKAWKESYESVASVQIAGLHDFHCSLAYQCTINSQTTLCSAAFASAAVLKLAHASGLIISGRDHKPLQRIAGRAADISTLQAAVELGLPLTDAVLIGTAESGSVSKLQWVHMYQGYQLPYDICDYAARCGHVDTLRWLQNYGGELTARTSEGAAAGAHLCVLEFLRDEGCEWDETACAAAAKHGHLFILRWLHEEGCPWFEEDICSDAAVSGSTEVLLYLMQQGCVLNLDTMRSAAMMGHLAICQFLVAEQCPFDAGACTLAAQSGCMEVMRFLIESGCPWDVDAISVRAAESGDMQLLQYLKQQGGMFSEDVMRAAAHAGDVHLCRYLYDEQCPWDTTACENAAHGGHVDTLRWLHEQDCPWDPYTVRSAAAVGGHADVLNYMHRFEPIASAAELTELLNTAGAFGHIAAAQWLRHHGARWPALLKHGAFPWTNEALQWARFEGCLSPNGQF
eukprot:1644-Heterococcus_DN1.PRE.5